MLRAKLGMDEEDSVIQLYDIEGAVRIQASLGSYGNWPFVKIPRAVG